jgi:hyperosmotically inducible periplasmic protein
MKRIPIILAILVTGNLRLVAADENAATSSNGPSAAAVDNTAINSRDNSGNTQTPGDQSNDPNDVKVTAAIRRAIVHDDNLSMTAKNVKIITNNGEVTLRGPVNSEQEKAEVEQLAKRASANAKIDNQLEVKQSQ